MKIAIGLLIGIGLVALLAAGAYSGAQALAKRGDGQETATLDPMTSDGLSGLNLDQSEGSDLDLGVGQAIEMDINPAAGLPERESDAFGFILQREDDTFLIGTGMPKMELQENDDGTINLVVTGTEGPSYEVVVTRDTQLFEDVSDITALITGEGGGSMQQEVKTLASLDDIDQEAQLQVWGIKSGERIIADVLLAIPPFVTTDRVDR